MTEKVQDILGQIFFQFYPRSTKYRRPHWPLHLYPLSILSKINPTCPWGRGRWSGTLSILSKINWKSYKSVKQSITLTFNSIQDQPFSESNTLKVSWSFFQFYPRSTDTCNFSHNFLGTISFNSIQDQLTVMNAISFINFHTFNSIQDQLREVIEAYLSSHEAFNSIQDQLFYQT